MRCFSAFQRQMFASSQSRYGATRLFTCAAVAKLMQSATPPPAAGLGKVVSLDDVAAAHAVPPTLLDQAKHSREILFTQAELARYYFASLIDSHSRVTKDLRLLENEVCAEKGSDVAHAEAISGAKEKLETHAWSTTEELMRFYEEVMHPIRLLHRQYEFHLLNSYHMKDVLKRGLSAFKQDYLDEQEAQLKIEKEGMNTCLKRIEAIVNASFTTDIANNLVNILRIAGEKSEPAHAMAVKVLEDMNMMKLPYNEITRLLVQIVSFRDGAFDNSALLFEIIEYPERGEVSLETGKLEAISDKILSLISNRHQTPLDDGVLLRSTETHPNLQRSSE